LYVSRKLTSTYTSFFPLYQNRLGLKSFFQVFQAIDGKTIKIVVEDFVAAASEVTFVKDQHCMGEVEPEGKGAE
jgi:hypothetical protein